MARKTPEQIYEEQEAALIGDAIAETEQEIADYAFGKEPDENDGDRSLEEMDGEDVLDSDEIEEEDEGEEGDTDDGTDGEEGDGEGQEQDLPDPRQAGNREPADRRGVPPRRLREEAEARRAAEARERSLRSEMDQLRGRLDAYERQTRQQPAQRQDGQPDPNAPPDLFADPDGRLQYERAQIAREFNERRINASFADAIDEHGQEAMDSAVRALAEARSPALTSEILNANNPGKAIMRWHERQQMAREIGSDPAAYRQRVREELLADPEFRHEIVTGLRNEAVRGGNTRTRLPPSLNSATGGTSHRGDTTPRSRGGGRSTKSIEEEIAASAWDD